MKGLIFVIPYGSFFISSWFNVTVITYKKHFLSFLLIEFIVFFLSSLENLYMIHHDWNLFYDIYNTLIEHNWRKTLFLPLIYCKLFWYLFKVNQKVLFITSSASWLIMISILSLFECIKCSSSLPYLEKIKLIVTADWIIS